MKKLVNAGVSGHASGKAILIGEHAAVDGHMAIALPPQGSDAHHSVWRQSRKLWAKDTFG